MTSGANSLLSLRLKADLLGNSLWSFTSPRSMALPSAIIQLENTLILFAVK